MASRWVQYLGHALLLPLLQGPAGAAASVSDRVAARSGQALDAMVANVSEASAEGASNGTSPWTSTTGAASSPFDTVAATSGPDAADANASDTSAMGASNGTGLVTGAGVAGQAELGALASLEAAAGAGANFYAGLCAAINCHSGLPLSSVRQFGEAAVGKSGQQCIAIFRGTANQEDAMQDAMSLALVDLPGCPGCRVGSGYLDGYRSLAGPVEGALRDLGCHSVAVTGHSLGGARAAIAAYDLAKAGFQISDSYTFGAPPVGNDAFRAAFSRTVHARFLSVVHGSDPVPHLGIPGAVCVGSEVHEPGHSPTTDHLHYSGVAMFQCTPDGVSGGEHQERQWEDHARSLDCCLRFEWSCCRPR